MHLSALVLAREHMGVMRFSTKGFGSQMKLAPNFYISFNSL